MASADGRIVIDIELEDGSVVRGLGDIGNQADRVGSRTSSAFGKVGGALKTVGTIAVGVVAGIGALGVAALGLSAPLVKAAADAQALNSQFSQVFAGIEKAAENSLAAIGQATSINTGRLRGSFVQIAAFARTTGVDTQGALELSSRALTAAADSAAFYDRSIEDTTESLQSFLKGNFENDAALGISATETTRNTVANKLYGKSFKDLDEAQKQLALLTLVEDGNKLGGALGQAARESDGLENVLGNLKQAYEDFKISLGDAILETAINLLKGLTSTINNIDTAPLVAGLTYVVEGLKSLYEYVAPTLELLRVRFLNVLSVISEYWKSNGEQIFNTASSVFSQVFSTVSNILSRVSAIVKNVLEDITEFWEENGEGIIRTVSTIFTFILAVINVALPVIQKILQTSATLIVDLIQNALVIIVGIVDVIAGILTLDFGRLWDGIVGIFSGAIGLIVDFFVVYFVGYILDAAKVFIGAISKVLSVGWEFISDLAVRIFKPIGEFFSSIWNSISSATSTTWNAISSFLSTVWLGITTTVSAVWGGIVSIFTTVWGFISGIFNSVLSSITFTINQYWNAISENVSVIWENIVSIFQNVWDIIKNVFLGTLLIIFDLVTGNWEKLRTDTAQIWDNITSAFSEIWESIKTIFTETLSAISNVIQQAWTNITYGVTTTFNSIKTFFVNLWNGIVSFFVNTFRNLKDTASSSSDSIRNTVSQVWTNIKDFFSTTLSNIVSTVKTKFSDIYNGASEKLNQVKKFFTDTFNEVVGFVSGINLYDIGKNIVQGLINGIGSLAGKIKDKVAEVVSYIPNGIRDLLNINSPSRVTTELGEFAGEGVEVGLDNSIRGIKKATNNVAKAAIPNNIVNRLAGSSVGVAGVSSGLLNSSTGTSNVSSVNNSTNPVYNINVQNDQSQELERTFRRLQFAY